MKIHWFIPEKCTPHKRGNFYILKLPGFQEQVSKNCEFPNLNTLNIRISVQSGDWVLPGSPTLDIVRKLEYVFTLLKCRCYVQIMFPYQGRSSHWVQHKKTKTNEKKQKKNQKQTKTKKTKTKTNEKKQKTKQTKKK